VISNLKSAIAHMCTSGVWNKFSYTASSNWRSNSV